MNSFALSLYFYLFYFILFILWESRGMVLLGHKELKNWLKSAKIQCSVFFIKVIISFANWKIFLQTCTDVINLPLLHLVPFSFLKKRKTICEIYHSCNYSLPSSYMSKKPSFSFLNPFFFNHWASKWTWTLQRIFYLSLIEAIVSL